MLHTQWCNTCLHLYDSDVLYISIIFRRVGKRKAAAADDKTSKRKARKEKRAKKDPNKPKRPPSAFFVFLFVSASQYFT